MIVSSFLRGEPEETLDRMKADESWGLRSERITTYSIVWLTRGVKRLPWAITSAATAVLLIQQLIH